MHYLIDTNVAVAANGRSSAGPGCVLAAVKRLLQLRATEILVLDDAFLILSEYDRNLRSTGQPGVGDAFYLWALRNRSNPRHCEQVALTIREDQEFTAFPRVPELAGFDPSDRKFVAAARSHPARPPVVNATDTDWYHHRTALTQHDVQIEFLCPAEMERSKRGNGW